jgi:hypothetical protein
LSSNVITPDKLYFSYSGGNSNVLPVLSVGGLPNTSQQLHNQDLATLFPDVIPDQARSGYVQHRCIYLWNVSSFTFRNPVFWISQHNKDAPVGEISIANGIMPASADFDNLAAAEPSLSNESVGPSGVTFTRPTTKAAGIPLGDIPGRNEKDSGFFKSLWIRRTTLAGTYTLHNDYFTITVEGPQS